MKRRAIEREADRRLRICLFGPLSARTATGLDVLPRARKAQAILCYLAMAETDRVPRQRLVELLWSTRWIDQGRGSLRQALNDLKSALAPIADVLEIERNEVRLNRDLVWIDYLTGQQEENTLPVAREVPRADLFLETLLGLDPQFDCWILATRSEITMLSDKSLPQSGKVRANIPAPATGAHRLLISVAPVIQIGTLAIDDFVAPALTLDLVTAIAKFRWLGVRQSPNIGEGDYRVEGYLVAVPDALRLILRLIDEHDGGAVLWTGECRMSLPLVESAMADLVAALVAQLDPEILAIETRKALASPVGENGAYTCVLRAIAHLYRFECSAWHVALEEIANAEKLDPHYARALAVSALCQITGIAQGWSLDPKAALEVADAKARRAIGLDPRDSMALALAGHIRAFVHHDFVSATKHFERALLANSSCGFAWAYSALTYAYLGEPTEARERLTRATSILSHDPFLSFVEGFEAVICYFAGDFEEVIAIERDQLTQRPKFTNSRKNLIAALCQLGRFEEARREQVALEADEPGFRWADHLRKYPFAQPADRRSLARVLEVAGLIDDTTWKTYPIQLHSVAEELRAAQF